MFSWPELTGAIRPDYDGLTYQEQEVLKYDAWRRFRTALTPFEQADAVEDVIRAHFDRSRESYRGRHPDFAVYAAHWVAAQTTSPYMGFSAAVRAILKKRYPPPAVRHIADGQTYWQWRRIVEGGRKGQR